ncbi:UTP--glucose-1-phosphate uridylyltransferase [Pullulanibacillus pueri]|uniref:UTP--glucose-1-phosphate uridylyltransferase n=1 Tax=Pullulanibacillus pueri TaxID=1437324 RepID=A0A8J2ZT08_9BACL|nr:UTP--glucose-1-phosphate uridylyltransferase GalU [Pullulanibacillus pueri]MBM7683631.1 UTP--glucose-1-phosphate uridylyltransferase [Pullulanibacillus pueri]GGH76624.1 UTP--glucose-1-phosphate uridylyltransferase [Pullulanibacillus pueri]
MKKIRKAIIPAAGLGTRFLPATKAMPKEMLPIVDTPAIQYIVEEAVASGIEDIIIVTGRNKRAIEDHFDNSPELEHTLEAKGKDTLLNAVQKSSHLAEIHYIRQKEPKGLGHAVWCARKFIGNEPFAVLLGDDIFRGETPGLKQLINQYEATHSSIIGVQEVPKDQTHRYGIIDPKDMASGRLVSVNKFVEKPVQGTAPSNLAIIGRYVLTPKIFDFLDEKEIGNGGEIQLTDAIQKLNTIEDVYAYNLDGQRFDTGEKLGFLQTVCSFALENPEISDDVLTMLKDLVHHYEHNKKVNSLR